MPHHSWPFHVSSTISIIVVMRYIRFPKKFPSDKILSTISSPPPSSSYYPTRRPKTLDNPYLPWKGRTRIPHKMQLELWNTAILADLDPKKHFRGLKDPNVSTSEDTVKVLEKKGSESILKSFAREKKINENMRKMPQRLKQFEEDRRKQKQASKPDLPF
ncbi:hypothetical protein SeMB42_g03175 [Synchytrium endobioticum]|uniref:MRPL25 domain-containing protein n=1 Tax=Synchytrium endobioticum TaxID=286115 RepID=A0A507D911_9FUNG|nr:hypothetical protein SeLEV6574_g04112 [Synchytrium endobioticum]TPX47835.1 hypothetical protein SeMB42_g03175 [Synchytrium endobioticum]